METETIDRLFLELSQVTQATTAKELALQNEVAALREQLRQIGDYTHDHSTGPAVPDALWEVRSMAYGA